MSGDENKGWLDKMFDAADDALDKVDRHADIAAGKGLWRVEEVIEEDGSRIWDVSNTGMKQIHVYSQALADRVCKLLNAVGEK